MSNKVYVWDPLIRLFHWSLIASFAVCYFTQEANYELHIQSGYLLLVLVAFRTLWGFIGTQHARFSDFLYSPPTIIGYLKDLAQFSSRRFIGHTPAGGAMIILLLLCMIVISGSGIALDGAENRAGPFADTMLFTVKDQVEAVHTISTNITLALIALHLLAIVLTSKIQKDNLVQAMFTGHKRSSEED